MEALQRKAGVSLLFAAGTRPSATEIEGLLAGSAEAGPAPQISYRPPDDHGRLELLASGLTFDVRGLAPGMAAPIPPVGQVYGLPADVAKFELEAVALAPAANIAGGGAMLPVVRVLMGLVANLALQLPVTAVCWDPAHSWMDPRYFGRIAITWLSGGTFPVLGLTGMRRAPDGALESAGLAFFTGQEIRVRERSDEPDSETVKLAGRIVDHLVRHGRLEQADTVTGPSGEPLRLEPSLDGRLVEVSREA